MQTKPLRQSGTKDLWLNAAYEVLISEGIDAVKVMSLAKQLNLTRTSFYWYFEDIAALHMEILTRWENQNTRNLVNRCNQDAPDICEALFNLMDCWLDSTLFDAPLDLAIRNWSRVNTDLQQKVSDADFRRTEAVTAMFARYGYTAEQAAVRGLTVIYTQIGYFSMRVKESKAERLARVPHYVELFAGVRPTDEDVGRFLKRHRKVGRIGQRDTIDWHGTSGLS